MYALSFTSILRLLLHNRINPSFRLSPAVRVSFVFLLVRRSLMDDFFKFPRTRHIFDAGGEAVSRDDLLYEASEFESLFLSGNSVTIEEKLDGANLGFSLAPDGK